MSDTGFSSTWLDLREPADHAARDSGLLAHAAACAREGSVILDLGSGTGSTARAFGDLATGCTWRFLDGDQRLLDIAAERHPGSEQVIADLREVNALPLDGVSLVTASALLDLMPEDWITALATRLKDAQIPLYAALNYNGQMEWTPGLADDASITDAFNQHQLTDKGLGPASGPNSASTTAAVFEAVGFTVHNAQSPWRLNGKQAPLHRELLKGIASAAGEIGNLSPEVWLQSRTELADQAHSVIGHTDILAMPRP